VNKCPKCGSSNIRFNVNNYRDGQCQSCEYYAEACTFEYTETEADRAAIKFMNKDADLDDPYWQLFEVKDVMNTIIVKAVEYGFKQGYNQAEQDIKLVEQTKWDYVKTFISKMNGWANFRAFLEREIK